MQRIQRKLKKTLGKEGILWLLPGGTCRKGGRCVTMTVYEKNTNGFLWCIFEKLSS